MDLVTQNNDAFQNTNFADILRENDVDVSFNTSSCILCNNDEIYISVQTVIDLLEAKNEIEDGVEFIKNIIKHSFKIDYSDFIFLFPNKRMYYSKQNGWNSTEFLPLADDLDDINSTKIIQITKSNELTAASNLLVIPLKANLKHIKTYIFASYIENRNQLTDLETKIADAIKYISLKYLIQRESDVQAYFENRISDFSQIMKPPKKETFIEQQSDESYGRTCSREESVCSQESDNSIKEEEEEEEALSKKERNLLEQLENLNEFEYISENEADGDFIHLTQLELDAINQAEQFDDSFIINNPSLFTKSDTFDSDLYDSNKSELERFESTLRDLIYESPQITVDGLIPTDDELSLLQSFTQRTEHKEVEEISIGGEQKEGDLLDQTAEREPEIAANEEKKIFDAISEINESENIFEYEPKVELTKNELDLLQSIDVSECEEDLLQSIPTTSASSIYADSIAQSTNKGYVQQQPIIKQMMDAEPELASGEGDDFIISTSKENEYLSDSSYDSEIYEVEDGDILCSADQKAQEGETRQDKEELDTKSSDNEGSLLDAAESNADEMLEPIMQQTSLTAAEIASINKEVLENEEGEEEGEKEEVKERIYGRREGRSERRGDGRGEGRSEIRSERRGDGRREDNNIIVDAFIEEERKLLAEAESNSNELLDGNSTVTTQAEIDILNSIINNSDESSEEEIQMVKKDIESQMQVGLEEKEHNNEEVLLKEAELNSNETLEGKITISNEEGKLLNIIEYINSESEEEPISKEESEMGKCEIEEKDQQDITEQNAEEALFLEADSNSNEQFEEKTTVTKEEEELLNLLEKCDGEPLEEEICSDKEETQKIVEAVPKEETQKDKEDNEVKIFSDADSNSNEQFEEKTTVTKEEEELLNLLENESENDGEQLIEENVIPNRLELSNSTENSNDESEEEISSSKENITEPNMKEETLKEIEHRLFSEAESNSNELLEMEGNVFITKEEVDLLNLFENGKENDEFNEQPSEEEDKLNKEEDPMIQVKENEDKIFNDAESNSNESIAPIVSGLTAPETKLLVNGFGPEVEEEEEKQEMSPKSEVEEEEIDFSSIRVNQIELDILEEIEREAIEMIESMQQTEEEKDVQNGEGIPIKHIPSSTEIFLAGDIDEQIPDDSFLESIIAKDNNPETDNKQKIPQEEEIITVQTSDSSYSDDDSIEEITDKEAADINAQNPSENHFMTVIKANIDSSSSSSSDDEITEVCPNYFEDYDGYMAFHERRYKQLIEREGEEAVNEAYKNIMEDIGEESHQTKDEENELLDSIEKEANEQISTGSSQESINEVTEIERRTICTAENEIDESDEEIVLVTNPSQIDSSTAENEIDEEPTKENEQIQIFEKDNEEKISSEIEDKEEIQTITAPITESALFTKEELDAIAEAESNVYDEDNTTELSQQEIDLLTEAESDAVEELPLLYHTEKHNKASSEDADIVHETIPVNVEKETTITEEELFEKAEREANEEIGSIEFTFKENSALLDAENDAFEAIPEPKEMEEETDEDEINVLKAGTEKETDEDEINVLKADTEEEISEDEINVIKSYTESEEIGDEVILPAPVVKSEKSVNQEAEINALEPIELKEMSEAEKDTNENIPKLTKEEMELIYDIENTINDDEVNTTTLSKQEINALTAAEEMADESLPIITKQISKPAEIKSEIVINPLDIIQGSSTAPQTEKSQPKDKKQQISKKGKSNFGSGKKGNKFAEYVPRNAIQQQSKSKPETEEKTIKHQTKKESVEAIKEVNKPAIKEVLEGTIKQTSKEEIVEETSPVFQEGEAKEQTNKENININTSIQLEPKEEMVENVKEAEPAIKEGDTLEETVQETKETFQEEVRPIQLEQLIEVDNAREEEPIPEASPRRNKLEISAPQSPQLQFSDIIQFSSFENAEEKSSSGIEDPYMGAFSSSSDRQEELSAPPGFGHPPATFHREESNSSENPNDDLYTFSSSTEQPQSEPPGFEQMRESETEQSSEDSSSQEENTEIREIDDNFGIEIRPEDLVDSSEIKRIPPFTIEVLNQVVLNQNPKFISSAEFVIAFFDNFLYAVGINNRSILPFVFDSQVVDVDICYKGFVFGTLSDRSCFVLDLLTSNPPFVTASAAPSNANGVCVGGKEKRIAAVWSPSEYTVYEILSNYTLQTVFHSAGHSCIERIAVVSSDPPALFIKAGANIIYSQDGKELLVDESINEMVKAGNVIAYRKQGSVITMSQYSSFCFEGDVLGIKIINPNFIYALKNNTLIPITMNIQQINCNIPADSFAIIIENRLFEFRYGEFSEIINVFTEPSEKLRRTRPQVKDFNQLRESIKFNPYVPQGRITRKPDYSSVQPLDVIGSIGNSSPLENAKREMEERAIDIAMDVELEGKRWNERLQNIRNRMEEQSKQLNELLEEEPRQDRATPKDVLELKEEIHGKHTNLKSLLTGIGKAAAVGAFAAFLSFGK